MRTLVVLLSMLFLGACAHNGGHHDGHGHHKSKCSKKWDKMDVDKDGKISKDEFMKHKQSKFALMDSDKDGFITKEDKKAAKKNCKSCK